MGLAAPVLAQDATLSSDSLTSDDPVRIELDQQDQAIRFIVDGREVARLTDTGLYVLDSITYRGVLTDGGGDSIEEMVGAIEGERDAE